MELTYTIKRSSRRRKLTITVERDRSVVVHAPASTSEEKIRFEQRFLIPAHLSHERRQVLRTWYMDRAKEKILPRARKFAADLGRGDLNQACGVQQFPEIGQTLFAKSLKELQDSVRHLLSDSKFEEKKI